MASKKMKFKEYKIICWTTALIPADENEWFITDAIDSIVMSTKPEDWIYEGCEVIDEVEKEVDDEITKK